jgi:tRNA A-37 threonylcarbamoyl transferase component Bud32
VVYPLRASWWIVFLTTAVIFLIALGVQVARLGELEPGGALISLRAAEDLGLSPLAISGYFLILNGLSGLAYLSVALFIGWRRPNHWWLALVSVMLTTFGVAYTNPAIYILVAEWSQFGFPVLLLRIIAHLTFIFFIYTFPDGRFSTRATKLVAILAMVWFTAAHLLDFYQLGGQETWLPGWTFVIFSALFYTGPVWLQSGPWSQTLGFPADAPASATEKQQIKWIVAGLFFALAGFFLVMLPILSAPLLAADALSTLLLGVLTQLLSTISLMVLPLAIGVAMMRYRLWDADFVINRGIVYTGLTVGLLLILIADLALLQQFFLLFTGREQSMIALVVAAAITGALFQPIRNWLQRFVDRRLFDIHIDYKLKPLRETAVDPQQTTLGPYQLGDLIGRGGMAEVYRAIDPATERTVAIKLLRAEQADVGEFRARFEREAQTVSALRHPNIIELLDFGVADDDHARGAHYMVMEYIDGVNLSDYLRDKGRLSLGETAVLLHDIAAALDYAHAQGVVHRDIKPSNVLLQPLNGSGLRPVLTDFGIAKMRGAGTAITQTGMVGTLDYISPEQIREARDVDGRTDLYSLGVMTYQLLTGRLPFQASNPAAVLIAHLQQPPPHPHEFVPDLPLTAVNALIQALAKEPEKRPASAGAFAQALHANV